MEDADAEKANKTDQQQPTDTESAAVQDAAGGETPSTKDTPGDEKVPATEPKPGRVSRIPPPMPNKPESLQEFPRPSRSILRDASVTASQTSVLRRRNVTLSVPPKGVSQAKAGATAKAGGPDIATRPKYSYLFPRVLREKLIEAGYFEEEERLTVKVTKDGPPLISDDHARREREPGGVCKLLFGTDLIKKGRLAYAEREAQHMKTGELFDSDLCIQIGLIIQPFVILFLIWDVIATVCFKIPHLTWSKHNGIIWPLHIIVFPLSLYGYMIRQTHFRKGALNFLAIFNMMLVIPLFIVRGYIDWYFFDDRYEGGAYFEVYQPGPEDRPFDYDPQFQYEALRIAKFWELEYDDDDSKRVADILRDLQDKDDDTGDGS